MSESQSDLFRLACVCACFSASKAKTDAFCGFLITAVAKCNTVEFAPARLVQYFRRHAILFDVALRIRCFCHLTVLSPQITAMAGTSVPLTKTEERLDASFGEIVEWLEKALGLSNPETIHITVVVDGTAYRGVLSAAQLLGHTLGSILGLAGAVDLDDSHSVVFIVRCFLTPHYVLSSTLCFFAISLALKLQRCLCVYDSGTTCPWIHSSKNSC